MANFNKVMLIGNLTRDPVLRYLPNQTAVVDFGLAVNRRWRTPQGEDREEVCYVDCSAFARQAETINQYCQKGKQLFVEGRLKFDSWEDKQGGGKRSKLSVVVENFQFLGGRDGAGQGGGGGGGEDFAGDAPPPPQRGPQRGGQRGPQRPQQQQPPEQPFGDEQKFADDDIPF
jgi:single-strand DNA-binding protein